MMNGCGRTPYVQNPIIFVSAVMNFLKQIVITKIESVKA